jgi:hypothetical protein
MIRRYWKLGAVGISCAAIGVGASAIASAGAATAGGSAAAKHKAARGGSWRLFARAVHGDLVVPTKNGFATITFDRGVVQSVSGQQLTLKEGKKTATYKTVTLTIPTNARVRDNGSKATLANVKVGQRALVVQGPNYVLVRARDARVR